MKAYFIPMFLVILGGPVLAGPVLNSLDTYKSEDFFVSLVYNHNDIVSGEARYILENPFDTPLDLKGNLVDFYIDNMTKPNNIYYFKTGILENVTTATLVNKEECTYVMAIDSYFINGSVSASHPEPIKCITVPTTFYKTEEVLKDLPDSIPGHSWIMVTVRARWTALTGFALEWIPRLKIYNDAKTDSVTLTNSKWAWWNLSMAYSRELLWTATGGGSGTAIVKINASGIQDGTFNTGNCTVNQNAWTDCIFDASGTCRAWLYYNDCTDYAVVDVSNTTRKAVNVVSGDAGNYSVANPSGILYNDSLIMFHTLQRFNTPDDSKYSNWLVINGGATETAGCVHGDCIRLTTGATFNKTATFLYNMSGFTWAAWLKFTSLTSNTKVWSNSWAGNEGWFINVGAGGDANEFFPFIRGSGESFCNGAVTNVIVAGNWEHWTVTFDSNTDTLRVYRNGTIVCENTGATTTYVAGHTNTPHLGCEANGGECADIYVDDLLWIDYAMTPREVNNTYKFIGSIGKEEPYIPPVELALISYIDPTPSNNISVGFNYNFVINTAFSIANLTPKNVTLELNNVNVSYQAITNTTGTAEFPQEITGGTPYSYEVFINTDEGITNTTGTQTLYVVALTQATLDKINGTVDYNGVIILGLIIFVILLLYVLIKL